MLVKMIYNPIDTVIVSVLGLGWFNEVHLIIIYNGVLIYSMQIGYPLIGVFKSHLIFSYQLYILIKL